MCCANEGMHGWRTCLGGSLSRSVCALQSIDDKLYAEDLRKKPTDSLPGYAPGSSCFGCVWLCFPWSASPAACSPTAFPSEAAPFFSASCTRRSCGHSAVSWTMPPCAAPALRNGYQERSAPVACTTTRILPTVKSAISHGNLQYTLIVAATERFIGDAAAGLSRERQLQKELHSF